jgi:hypothetical protein
MLLASGTDTNAAWWQLAAAVQSSFDLNAERTAIASWQAHHRIIRQPNGRRVR